MAAQMKVEATEKKVQELQEQANKNEKEIVRMETELKERKK